MPRIPVTLSQDSTDTIAAIATPRGNAGVGIIRISGSAVIQIQQKLYTRSLEPRRATLVEIFDNQARLLDHVLLIFFPGPNSFTGEDVLELQGHGGVVILDMLLEYILSLGCRHARAGEFSERAFLNGKIDLTQAEAIADLIESQTRSAARGAARSLQGEFSAEIFQLVEDLVHIRMLAEAHLDFPDEEIEDVPVNEFKKRFSLIHLKLKKLLSCAQSGSLLRDGFHLVLAGSPNAGKSSLLNALTKNETAIVSDRAGTTRDVLRDQINMDGVVLDVSDTAGLRHTTDEVETEGIRRTKKELKRADHVLIVIDEEEYSEETKLELLSFVDTGTPVTILRNKIDLKGIAPAIAKKNNRETEILLSVKSSAGMDILLAHIKNITATDASNESTYTARRRHIGALKSAAEALENSDENIKLPMQLELFAEDCRRAQKFLNEITGEFNNEDLLGKIFGSFCIGK